METFADVLHSIVDKVLDGDIATKAHAILDAATGHRTPEPEPAPADAAATDAPADDTPGDPAGETVPGA